MSIFTFVFGAAFLNVVRVVFIKLFSESYTSTIKLCPPYPNFDMSIYLSNPGVGLVLISPYPFIALKTSGRACLGISVTSTLSTYALMLVFVVDITHPIILNVSPYSCVAFGMSIFTLVL